MTFDGIIDKEKIAKLDMYTLVYIAQALQNVHNKFVKELFKTHNIAIKAYIPGIDASENLIRNILKEKGYENGEDINEDMGKR